MDDIKVKLRSLRDKLAFAALRASSRAGLPPALATRLNEALEAVSAALRLATTPASAAGVSAEAAEEVIEDAVVEGHVVLHEWERAVEQAQAGKNKPRVPLGGAERRQHPRQEALVTVRLLRHALHEVGSGVALDTETVDRPARNVSLGGIFVAATAQDLPQVGAGSVLHVAIASPLGASLSFRARAAVVRRDDSGLALRWIVEGEKVRHAIEALLVALNRARLGA